MKTKTGTKNFNEKKIFKNRERAVKSVRRGARYLGRIGFDKKKSFEIGMKE